jgi:transporter family-2 protein
MATLVDSFLKLRDIHHVSRPRLGVGNAIRLVVTGQIVAAVIIDHVGTFGAVVQRLTMGRAIGVVLMIIGVIPARR